MKSLIDSALSDFEKQIEESILTPKMRVALAGISQGQTFNNAVKHCEAIIDKNPGVDRVALCRDTASKLNISEESLYERLKDYKPAKNEDIQLPVSESASLTEKAPADMEPWIKANKEKFKSQYGADWEKILYATAWEISNSKHEKQKEDK
jgi:hypothetical protein